MKRLFMALLFVPFISFSQKKGDNLLIIKNDSLTLKKIAEVLLRYGFELEPSNQTPESVNTRSKRLSDSLQVRIHASEPDTRLFLLEGFYNIPQVNTSYQRIKNDGMKGSPAKRAWELLLRITKEFKCDIEFKKEISRFDKYTLK